LEAVLQLTSAMTEQCANDSFVEYIKALVLILSISSIGF
jgi:hypothetical protein